MSNTTKFNTKSTKSHNNSSSTQNKSQGRERENTADDVAEMRNIVDVRQGTGDEDVALPRNRKLWRRPNRIRHDDVIM